MPMQLFTRGQTQILYRYLPEAIFEHDDYGLCKVVEVVLEETEEINRSALFDTLIDALQQWEREEFRSGFPDTRTERGQRKFKVGQPREVRFDPFPLVLQCRSCRHVVEFGKINKRGINPGQCPRPGCGGKMQQMPYVEAHNCGRLQEMYVPPKGCPEHGIKFIRFYNPGRTQAARWMCGVCEREIQKPRMTPCKCAYSEAVPELGRSQYEKYMRLYPTSEPGLYIPHVVAFINFREQDEKKLSQLEDGLPLLLARLWGVLDGKVLELAEERNRWKPGAKDLSPEMKAIVDALEKIDPNHPDLLHYKKSKENPPGKDVIDRVRALLGGTLPVGSAPRKLVEHVALQDTMNLTSVDTVVKRLRERSSNEQAERFERDSMSMLDRLGLLRVQVVNDFPIALTALGYTRVTRDPQRSIFNPFPAGEDGRIPLFALPTDTEGLWFQLDPLKVSRWLRRNNFIGGAPPEDRLHAWSWLYREVLGTGFARREDISAGAGAIQILVHTMSHVLLRKIEWSGFSPSSVGEYLMPETLSFVLYANRFAESKIGGLTTLFEQRLPLWLQDAAQSGQECIYDPLCEEDGGSCVGCLHREHNCPFFNRELSRAVLYGGVLPADEQSGLRIIRYGYWEEFMKIVPDE